MKIKYTPGKMRLPAPDVKGDEAIFYPIHRIGNWEPYGYTINPEDKLELLPIPRDLLLLEEAKRHLKQGFSLRDVAKWLSEEGSRKISHQGLKVRIEQDQKKEKEELIGRQTLKQLVEVYKKTRRIEAQRLGVPAIGAKTVEEELIDCIRKST